MKSRDHSLESDCRFYLVGSIEKSFDNNGDLNATSYIDIDKDEAFKIYNYFIPQILETINYYLKYKFDIEIYSPELKEFIWKKYDGLYKVEYIIHIPGTIDNASSALHLTLDKLHMTNPRKYRSNGYSYKFRITSAYLDNLKK